MSDMPTTKKQLRLYDALNKNGACYMLIGTLAAMFYGRNRATDDIDILIDDTEENHRKVMNAMRCAKYPLDKLLEKDFITYGRLRCYGDTVVDIYMEYNGIKYGDVSSIDFEYDGVKIPVVIKKDLLRLMRTTGLNSEDIEVLKLLDDVYDNKDEINERQ